MEYDDVINRIAEVQTKLCVLKESIYSIKGISYDDIPRESSGNADISHFIGEIDELEAELEELKEQKDQLRSKHEKEIDKVKNNKYKSVLRMVYISKLGIYKIADALKISVSYARKLKKEAIDEFIIQNDIK